ncbi:hypothetical protein WJX77_005725 [Trebouxia sp. C0004]
MAVPNSQERFSQLRTCKYLNGTFLRVRWHISSAAEYHGHQAPTSDFEAGLAEALLGEGPPSKKAKTGVADLGREEIAALINKKLPTASSYSKTTGGWADSRYKTIRPCMNFHRQHTLQDQRTTPVALLDTSWHLGTSC